jgi:hypothetical protein
MYAHGLCDHNDTFKLVTKRRKLVTYVKLVTLAMLLTLTAFVLPVTFVTNVTDPLHIVCDMYDMCKNSDIYDSSHCTYLGSLAGQQQIKLMLFVTAIAKKRRQIQLFYHRCHLPITTPM